ncbi:MAG: hypothetical protein IPM98_18825 [Lewinellaceae bacterium]|nr:hypothetical protein [Lewinellaceae bacterium]
MALDTTTNALYCTCPFLPKPCVHARALGLLFARAGEAAFEPTEILPDWVATLVRSPFSLPSRQAGKPPIEQQARRRSERLERAQHGFDDLELWLLDTLRRGVATAASEDPDFYKNIAARLADASMRSLSRSIRTLEAVPADRPDWPERVTAVLADAALALHAFRRREHLSEALLHDLEAFIGITLKKETVRAEGKILRDIWAVLGGVEEQVEEQLHQRRTWLLGVHSGRYALLLEYAYGEPEFLPGLAPGSVAEGEVVFYPSAWPHRALVFDELKRLPKPVEKIPGFEKIEDAVRAYAGALGEQPWLPAFPMALSAVTPGRHKDRFGLADTCGKWLPLGNDDLACWSLVALGGGRPLAVFGEWDGTAFRVFSAVSSGRFVGI